MLKKLKPRKEEVVKTEQAEMSFLDHLDELRKVIVRSLVSIVIFAVLLYCFSGYVFEYIILAHKSADFVTYKFFCKYGFCMEPPIIALKSVNLGEQFFTDLKVSFYGGLIVAFPYVFYQVWGFIRPGLYKNEQNAAKGVVFVCSALFFLGIFFGYFVMSPFAINFLGNYSVSPLVSNEVSLTSYVGYLTMFIIPTGILFQLPLFVYFLARIGLVTPEHMRKYRKHAFVGILVVAAILTPPDVVTQFLIGVPVYGMYELSIFVAARTAKKRQKELDS